MRVTSERGSVLLYGVVALSLLLMFVTLSVDWGRIVMAKAELQQAADSAARYAAAGLPLGVAEVQTRAATAIAQNKVDGSPLTFSAADLEFGLWDTSGKTFTVLTGTARNGATAVRVTAARDATHGSPLSLVFGKAIGRSTVSLKANATVARGHPSTVEIDAKASPWLAGMPNSAKVPASVDNPKDSKAPQSTPEVVSSIKLQPGKNIVFRQASGETSYEDAGNYGPDGNTSRIVAQSAVNGINTTKAPLNSLVGIFLDDRQPDTYAQSPVADFTTPASRDFDTLQPAIKQVFFIGDGINSAGKLQEFKVPPGATRLYIALMDEKGWWWDNTGSINVTVMDDKLTTVH